MPSLLPPSRSKLNIVVVANLLGDVLVFEPTELLSVHRRSLPPACFTDAHGEAFPAGRVLHEESGHHPDLVLIGFDRDKHEQNPAGGVGHETIHEPEKDASVIQDIQGQDLGNGRKKSSALTWVPGNNVRRLESPFP